VVIYASSGISASPQSTQRAWASHYMEGSNNVVRIGLLLPFAWLVLPRLLDPAWLVDFSEIHLPQLSHL
jgi:hypothetical protein